LLALLAAVLKGRGGHQFGESGGDPHLILNLWCSSAGLRRSRGNPSCIELASHLSLGGLMMLLIGRPSF
jgi:hypothetical protein